MAQPINYILQHPLLKEEAVKVNVDLKYQRSFLQGYSKDIPREAAVMFSANEINIKLRAIRAIRTILYNYYQLVQNEIPSTSSDSRPEIEEDHEWDGVSVEKPDLYGDNPLPMGITVGQYMHNGRPSFGIPEYLLAFREEQDKEAAKKSSRGRKRAGAKDKSRENKRKMETMGSRANSSVAQPFAALPPLEQRYKDPCPWKK